MTLLWLALLASALCGVANLLDRSLVHGDADEASPMTLLAIGGAIHSVMALFLGAWTMPVYGLDPTVFVPLFLNGAIYSLAIWLYLSCLKTEDTSRVVPFFQLIPLFGLVMANLRLGELPTPFDRIGIACLVAGGLALSLKRGVVRGRLALFMILAAGLIALSDVVFAEFGRGHAFSGAVFADWSGKGVFGLLALASPRARRGFLPGLRSKIGLMLAGEVTYAIGDALFDIAKLVMPVAIAQAAFCSQPLFVYLGVILLASRFPSLREEPTGAGERIRKLTGILLMVAGGIVLST
ncbi:MAG: EamA family transporter [Kiritimatiellae bacterium]|nr:EamA family transporter [Kiritimatiellia bacterium]